MPLILGLDFETQGTDPTIHAISEVGAVLWDTDYQRAVDTMGYLVEVSPDAPLEQEAVDITGLTPELLVKHGKNSSVAIKRLLNLYDRADFICAHNGNRFDRPFLRAWMQAEGITDNLIVEDKLWLDTLVDIEYPKGWVKQLTCLAAYHGFINPFPHNAVFDVMTMIKVLSFYSLDKVVETARTPTIAARIVHVPFEDKEWPKSHGFHSYYHNNKFQFWIKVFKEDKFDAEFEEVKAAGYELKKLPAIPEGAY